MAEENQTWQSRVYNSYGAMSVVGEFMEIGEIVKMQQLNKRFYDQVVPKMRTKVEMPLLTLVLESARKSITVGFWRDNQRECSQQEILKIGTEEGCVSPADLGFGEIYFQYFISIGHREFIAFPIEHEAILKDGFIVKFNASWGFESSTKIAPLGENTMRPTGCLLGGGKDRKLLMLGGRQDRSSQMYDFKTEKWMLSPKLPLGHNITTNITVNWKNKAVFTFIIDAQLTIKSAVLDLEKCVWTEHDTENTSEMEYAMTLLQTTHKIDRLHLKTAIVQADGTIAVFARGRTEGMKQQISGLILYFKVTQAEGKYAVELAKTQRVFPSIFCRQLDFAQRINNKMVITQDTADEEKFEAFSIDMSDGVFRGDGVCQKHFRHIFSK